MNEKVPSTSIVECFLSIILYLMPWSNNCTQKNSRLGLLFYLVKLWSIYY